LIKKLLLSATVVLPMLAMAQTAHAQRAGEKIANRHICVFKKNSVSRSDVTNESRRVAQAHGGVVTDVYAFAIRGFAANLSDGRIAQLKASNPNIAYCEQEQVFTAIQTFGTRARAGGGGTIQPAQETPWGIARVKGGAAGTFATAWVIDSGIAPHPDLNLDTVRSRGFLGRDTSSVDANGHGTHVAGTIAAMNNDIGVVGVAPGAKLVAVRVLDRRGSGSTSGVIAGVNYVAQNGKPGDVANMSLGGGVSQALDDAVVAAAAGGVRFALAAGNESDNANNHSPGRANGPNIYTVSAFSVGDKWATFSNFGSPPVDWAEPGVAIKSTWLAGGYNTISGTSMATPHMAGILLRGAPVANGTVAGDPDASKEPIGVAGR
jgi:subtilisin family serine protease